MREIPAYIQKLGIQSMPMVNYTTAGADATMRASQELGAFAQNMQENSQKVERLRAQATMREEMHRMSREYGSDPAALQQGLDKYRGEFVANLPAGMQEEFNQIYRMESVSHIDAASNKYNANLRDNMQVEGLRNFTASTNNLKLYAKMMEQAETPEQREMAAAGFQSTFKSMQEVADLGDVDGNIFSPEQRMRMLSEGVAAPITAMSPQGQILALNPPAGFEANLPLIHEFEGKDQIKPNKDGVDKVTGNLSYAWRGVNSEKNPEAYAEIMRLVDAGKVDEAANIADQLYKQKYWDDVGIDQLPPQYHAIIFDASVNQGENWAKSVLVPAALKGTPPSEILAMREERYRNTEGGDAEKRSWANRIKKLTPIAMGENKDLIPVEYRERLDKGIKEALEREQQLRMNDYGGWAVENNIDVPTRVQQQEAMGRPFIQVVPEAEAKQVVASLKNYTNADDFIGFAGQLSQKYAGAERHAITDLVRHGLEPEMEQAFMLSTIDPNKYKDHIDAIFQTKILGDELNNLIKGRDIKPSEIEAEVAAKFASSENKQVLAYKYGKGTAQAEARMLKSMQSMAKGYLAQNPTASSDDAVKFALRPMQGEYTISRVEGNYFEVPLTEQADNLTRRMKEYYKKALEPAMPGFLNSKGMPLKGSLIVPVLNEKEDGYRFVDVTGEPVKVGDKTVEVSIQELKNAYAPAMQIFDVRSQREKQLQGKK